MFASRQDAGLQLGARLVERGVRADRVLGLVRGGVVVAAEVAKALRAPLDVALVRKIGHPHYREFALGALAEGDVVSWNPDALRSSPVSQDLVQEVLEEERQRLQRHREMFTAGGSVSLEKQRVVLVDDGLATGSSMAAAIASARQRGAEYVVVAVPVASDTAFEYIRRIADEAHALIVDSDFMAVGAYYVRFPQVSDEEVKALLQQNRGQTG